MSYRSRMAVVCLSFLLLLNGSPVDAEGQMDEQKKYSLTFIVRSSPEAGFESRLHIQNPFIAKEIIESKGERVGRIPELPFAVIAVNYRNQAKQYMVSYSYNLFLLDEGVKIIPSQVTKKKISMYLRILSKHHYGEVLSWEEASRVFPRKGYAQVVDLETGLRFYVQRRAGSRHADAQPLTAEDTKVMKKIYSGKWSWKRRAILVRANGRSIAASMHGMPHGSGAIKENNFPGHFCIHFKDSTTHRHDYPDPGHDLMISKSSGLLHQRIVESAPEALVSLFIAAVNEQDQSIVKLMLNQHEPSSVQEFIKGMEEIESIRLKSMGRINTVGINQVVAQLPVHIQIQKRGQKDQNMTIDFMFTRGSSIERWKLELEPLIKQLIG